VSNQPLTIAIGADNAGYSLKERLKAMLQSDERVAEVIDLGVGSRADDLPCPRIGIKAAETVRSARADRALLCCRFFDPPWQGFPWDER
jgi:ribose 5-phosphate isomerase B